MEAKEDQLRDWSSLLPEVLNLIAKNLSEISDFVRFRAVCKAWRFSTPITDQPPQFPWIYVHGHGEVKPEFCCYSITSNKKYTINAPKIFRMARWTVSNGYVIPQHPLDIENKLSYQFFLFNPLNNHEIRLPAFNYDKDCRWTWKYQMGEYVFCRQHDTLSFWHLGQNSWHKLNLGSCANHLMMLCYKNMIFFLEEETGVTKAIDMFTGTPVYDIPPTEDYSIEDARYMVEDSGDILTVIRSYSDSERFDVYQLDANKSGSRCWVKVTSIGDRALFIDCCSALTLRANDFARIKRNSIYFNVLKDSHDGECEIRRMDMATGEVEHLPCSIKEQGYWFVPNLHQMLNMRDH